MEELMALMKKGGGSGGDNPIGENEVLKFINTNSYTPSISTYALNENLISNDLYVSGSRTTIIIVNCQGHTLADFKTATANDFVFGFNDNSIVKITASSSGLETNYDISQLDYLVYHFLSTSTVQDRYMTITN